MIGDVPLLSLRFAPYATLPSEPPSAPTADSNWLRRDTPPLPDRENLYIFFPLEEKTHYIHARPARCPSSPQRTLAWAVGGAEERNKGRRYFPFRLFPALFYICKEDLWICSQRGTGPPWTDPLPPPREGYLMRPLVRW